MDQKIKIGKNGRMLIPAEFRRYLGFEDGNDVILHLDEDGLRISTPAQAISRAQSLVRRYVPEGADLSGELMADRRAEADLEGYAEVEAESTGGSERSHRDRGFSE